MNWTYTTTISESWLHGVVYYKFNGLVYNKFPIDLWENICDFLAGKGISYFMGWTLGKLMEYSTFNHSCPFKAGPMLVKADNISIENFPVEPLLPSGRFRVDADFTGGDRVPTASFQIFFSVSDHRLEKV